MTSTSIPADYVWCPAVANRQDSDPLIGPFASEDAAWDYAENGHACTVACAHRVVQIDGSGVR